MATDVSPWEEYNAQEDRSRVIRHAPDADGYHMPDSEQMRKMGSGRVGAFAVIPAARKDGASRGFDPTVAGPVHVDPDQKDGGVIFDAATLNPQAIQAMINQNDDPYQVFKALGVPARSREYTRGQQLGSTVAGTPAYGLAAPQPHNPHMPNSYVTPSASMQRSQVPRFVNAVQEVYSVNPAPSLSTLPPITMNQPQGQPVMQQPQQMPQPQQPQQPLPAHYYAPQPAYQPVAPMLAAPQQPPPMDANMMGMMQSLMNMQQQIAALVEGQKSQASLPPTTGVSATPLPTRRPLSTKPAEMRAGNKSRRGRRNEEEDEEDEEDTPPPQQTLQAYTDSLNTTPEAVIAGFETLKLRFVTGPIAHKARKVVIFDIPNGGRHMARFHEVIVTSSCVVLVYDIRYEDGNQYMPPELGDKTLITVELTEGSKKTKSYKVASLGLQYNLGVFDHIVLVRAAEDQVDYEDAAQDIEP